MTEPSWLALARGLVGVHEIKGPESNPAVLALFRDAGFSGVKDEATAWCAAFVGAVLKRSGIRPSGSLLAMSYRTWGVPLVEPALGCIGVKRRRGGAAWQGHLGFVVAANADTIWLLGGNQGDAVSIAPFPFADFVAFRWPAGQPLTHMALPTRHVAAAPVSEA